MDAPVIRISLRDRSEIFTTALKNMRPLRVFVQYEYGIDLRPHGSASLRLLRPLSHPRISDKINLFLGSEYTGEKVDIVIVDRLWRPDVSFELVEQLVDCIHGAKAKLIYSLDDNFFDIPDTHVNKPSQEKMRIVEYLLRGADGILVTSQSLKHRFEEFNQEIFVIAHALDERLLVIRQPQDHPFRHRKHRKVIGYMGTLTHDDDLLMILPALKVVFKNHPGAEFQIIGGIGKAGTPAEFSQLPVTFIPTGPGEEEYPLFMVWYTSRTQWDIALAPLQDNAFNRSKSDIKFLDYCAIGAAGIFSNLPPYHSSVAHGERGLLVDNNPESWIRAMEKLLNEEDTRIQLALNATRYLYSQRTLSNCAEDWLNALHHYINLVPR